MKTVVAAGGRSPLATLIIQQGSGVTAFIHIWRYHQVQLPPAPPLSPMPFLCGLSVVTFIFPCSFFPTIRIYFSSMCCQDFRQLKRPVADSS